MLLAESRRATRTTPAGDLVLLADQDRSLWDRVLIAEGQAIVRQCLLRNRPGPYQIQAAIQAVHSDAPTAAATDWRQILEPYDQLQALAPGPVVTLNRAVAVAEVEGPEAALALVDGLDLGGLPTVPRRPRRPPPTPGPPHRGGAGLRRGDRPQRERDGARVPAAQTAGAGPGLTKAPHWPNRTGNPFTAILGDAQEHVASTAGKTASLEDARPIVECPSVLTRQSNGP
jgi:hypothetical protein